MRLVYKFYNYDHNDELFALCRISKNLYNQALYAIRKRLDEFNEETDDKKTKFLFYDDLDKLMKVTTNLEGTLNYRLLKAQVAQHTLKVVDANIRAYIRAIKDWKKNPEKYNGMPEFPRYLKKNGYFQLVYTNQCCKIKDGMIYLDKKLSIKIPQWEKYGKDLKQFNQVRILPKKGYTEIEIVYIVDDMINPVVDKNRAASIDLGISNFATMVTDYGEPIIYSGGIIKSKNQYFNKKISKFSSLAETNNKKKTTNRICRLWQKRDVQLTDIYHKISRHIVDSLISHGVGTLIVGYNEGWKDSINLGDKTNQKFSYISYSKFISLLRYKCEMAGILFISNEESYTSKCDVLAQEKIEKHNKYLGKRVKRGLFQSSTGKLINADVNGALNIMRKVIGDSQYIKGIIDSGRLFRPEKLKNLYSIEVRKL